MVDDTLHGKRNKRGDWHPHAAVKSAPLFAWPFEAGAFARWLFGYPGYILPWNFVYAATAAVVWLYLTPGLDAMRTVEAWWVAVIFARNAGLVILFAGGWHLWLYMKRHQGTAFKYNGQWPSGNNDAFLFKNQNVDNVIWTFASAVPFWTAYEVLALWLFASGRIPYVSFKEHPLYCLALMLLIPLFREVHFYLVHRLIHWPPLYKTVHKLHHNNVNPGPWSGLAMHPVEHLLYFSGVLIHVVVPSHPVHAIFHLVHAALSPAQGHAGFDKIVVGETLIDVHGHAHYLHHKYFECNYADGAVPLDKWFGTFHDGSKESQDAMDKRFMAKNEARNAKA